MNRFSSSDNPLINGNIQGDSKFWFVGIIFFSVGLLIAILIPYFLTPKIGPNFQITSGEITDIANDGDETYAEIYTFTTASGAVITGQEGIWSSSPAYSLHDQVEIYYDPANPQINYIKDDRNLQIVLVILYGLGTFFALFGAIIIFLKIKNFPSYLIDRYMGTAGALSYGIPATLAWPLLIYFHDHAPNFLFKDKSVEMPSETFWIGMVFSLTGLVTIFATIAILKAVRGTTDNTIGISKQF